MEAKSLSKDSITNNVVPRLVSGYTPVNWTWLFSFTVISLGTGLVTTPHMGFATFAYSLLIFGLIHRKNKSFHSKTMTLAIGFDISLVLFLELTRSAVDTAVKFELTLGQKTHIVTSLVSVLLYLPLLFMGFKMFLNSDLSAKYRSWHISFGGAAMVFRTIGLLTMFYFLK